jgi:hypothetical protein
MTDFREFYVPQGAGRNFLASKCLLTDTSMVSNKLNEITAKDLVRIKRYVLEDSTNRIPVPFIIDDGYKFDDEDMISESIKMKSVLIELDKWISKLNNNKIDYCRTKIIKNPSWMWRNSHSSDYTDSFFHINMKHYQSGEMKILIVQIQDYFAKCREYFYNECERNDYVSFFLITHQHPHDSISPRLQFPKSFKSLAMKFDSKTEIMTRTLDEIKRWKTLKNKFYDSHVLQVALADNRNVKFSDDNVSYRKIFFENDSAEIMKIYDFFDNKDYFQENKTDIMSEFRQYHVKNMQVIQQFVPDLFNTIKPLGFDLYKELKTR